MWLRYNIFLSFEKQLNERALASHLNKNYNSSINQIIKRKIGLILVVRYSGGYTHLVICNPENKIENLSSLVPLFFSYWTLILQSDRFKGILSFHNARPHCQCHWAIAQKFHRHVRFAVSLSLFQSVPENISHCPTYTDSLPKISVGNHPSLYT
jgi:hypothetical protein